MSTQDKSVAGTTTLVGTAVLWLLLIASGFAQSGSFENKPGTWGQEIQPQVYSHYALTAAEAKAFGQRMETLAAVVREASVFNPPLGFQPRFRARTWLPDECSRPAANCKQRVVPAQIGLTIYYFFKGQNGEAAWGGENCTGAGIWVNDPRATFNGTNYDVFGAPYLLLSDGRHICFEPQKTAEVGGFPLYDDTLLIITKNARPYWVPVTRKQYLEALIRFHEAELARNTERLGKRAADPYQAWLSKADERREALEQAYERLKKIDPAKAEELRRKGEQMESQMAASLKKSGGGSADADPLRFQRDIVTALRRELEAMKPAEQESQAWYKRPGDKQEDLYRSGLAPAVTAQGRALVTLNPDFLDHTRSRADWQLITVHFSWTGYSPEFIGAKRLREACHTIDWRRVASLLD